MLVLIFAPLLIILLLGLSFDTQENLSLTIGVHAPVFSQDVNAFTKTLQDANYSLVKYENNITACTKDIAKNLVHACLSLPENFQIESNDAKQITIHTDPTRLNLVYAIQETLNTHFIPTKTDVSQTLTQNILTTLTQTKEKITQEQQSIDQIKTKAADTQTQTGSVKTALTSVDLTVQEKTYNATALTQISNNLAQVKSNLNESLTQLNLINTTQTDRTKVSSKLDLALAQLDNVSAQLTPDSSLNKLIEQMQTDITQLNQKITSASQSVQSTSTNLDQVSSSMQEISTKLDEIKKSLQDQVAQIDAQKVNDAAVIASPFNIIIEPLSESNTYLNAIFPTLLVLAIMFGSLLLGTTLVMVEKTSPAFFRNFFLPIKKSSFIIAIYLTNLIMSIIQIIIILAVAVIFLSESIATFPFLALVLFIAATIFAFIGMILGYLFNSEESGVLASVSLGSLFLFLSGAIIPLEAASTLVKGIVNFNPFVIAENLIRSFFFFNATIADLYIDLLILVGYAVFLFIIILILESLLHKHLANRFMKHHHKRHKHEQKLKKAGAKVE